MNAPDIDRYFEQYGWHATQVAEGCWRAAFRGDYATFAIDVRLTTDWLFFTIDLPPCEWSQDRASKLLAANAQRLLAGLRLALKATCCYAPSCQPKGLLIRISSIA